MKLAMATSFEEHCIRRCIPGMTSAPVGCLVPSVPAWESEAPTQPQHASWRQALQRLSLTSVRAAASRMGHSLRRSSMQVGRSGSVPDRFLRRVQERAP